MENYKKKAIQLIIDLALAGEGDPSVIPYYAAKTSVSQKEAKYFPRRIGAKGYSYARSLSDMLAELESEKRSNPHSIMVVKDGEVICEASQPGYDCNIRHLAHSMSKTVTGLGIGFLFDEGKLTLDERLTDIFPSEEYSDVRFSDMTLRHLLSMQSGVPFAELGSVTEEAWTKAFFDSSLSFAPGEKFAYNSMNSYILARIITRLSGETLTEYISRKLFEPLGIDNFLWEVSPEGIEKGGFGLYLSAESFAKIGYMMLMGGLFEGKRIISEEYLSLMTSVQTDAPEGVSGFDYGLHIWVSPDGEEYLFNGMLGQNVWISPRNNIVVSVTAGNNELFTDSPTLEIIRKHLAIPHDEEGGTRADFKRLRELCDNFFVSRRCLRPLTKKRGLLYALGIKSSTPYDERLDKLLGSYAFRKNNAGILPAFVSVMQNNYMGGIEKIKLERRQNIISMTVTEGAGVYEIPVGLYGFAESVIDFKGEKYIVRATAEAMEDENRAPLYKIELVFPELPNTKLIKITHTDEGILIRMSEMPNQRIAESYISSLSDNGRFGLVKGLLEKKMGEGFIEKRLDELFNPSIYGIDMQRGDFAAVIERDNANILSERERNIKFIKSVISKFISEEKPEKPKSESSGLQGFFAKALSLLFRKAEFTEPERASEQKDGKEIIEVSDEVISFLDSEF